MNAVPPIKCPVCKSLVDEEDLFCANCGTESPHGESKPAGDGSRLATCNFDCEGCGASMSYDASAGQLRCPFCGSTTLTEKPDVQILAPRSVIPFRVGRDQAAAMLSQWLGTGWFRPGDLRRRAAVVFMQPVFVPYWVFHARTHTHWTADTDQTPPDARGDWYPMAGEHRGEYAGLLIGASGALAPAETRAICPFDLSQGKPPAEIDLENITVEQFSVPRKYARPLAREALDHGEAAACAGTYVPGRSRNVHVSVLPEGFSSEPVLLPVWITAYRYRDRVYRFLINGQTGRATGNAPISLAKIALLVGGLVVGALAVLGLLGSLAGR